MQTLSRVTLFLLLASPANAADPPAGKVSNGLAIIQRECSVCHAVGETDKSPNPKSPPFRVIAKRYPPDSIVEALAEGIVTGHNDMPEYMLEPEEITAIVGYLESFR
jgi:cytochrome c